MDRKTDKKLNWRIAGLPAAQLANIFMNFVEVWRYETGLMPTAQLEKKAKTKFIEATDAVNAA